MNENVFELDLFYNTAVSAIRESQVQYLRKMKAKPFEQNLPHVEALSAGDYARLRWWEKISYKWTLRKQRKAYDAALRKQKRPVDDDLTCGYNAGIEMALRDFKEVYKATRKELLGDNK